MAEMVIRPTMKFIYLGYIMVIVIVAASVVALDAHPNAGRRSRRLCNLGFRGCQCSFCCGR